MSSDTEKRLSDLEKDVAVIKTEIEPIKKFQEETRKDRRTFVIWFVGLMGSGILAFLGMVSKKLGLWQ